MTAARESPTQIDEDEEEEQGHGHGYPAKRQRLVQFPRDGPANSVPTTSTVLDRANSFIALSSAQRILTYSSPLQAAPAEHNGGGFEAVVEAAKGRATEAGQPELAGAIDDVYKRSRFDRTLRALLNAVLTHSATAAQVNAFQSYARVPPAAAKNTQSNVRSQASVRETQQDSLPQPENDNYEEASHGYPIDFISNASVASGGGSSGQLRRIDASATVSSAATKESPAFAQLVCFGMIPHVACKRLHGSMLVTADDTFSSGQDTGYISLNLIIKRGRFIVGIQSCREVAYLNTKLTNVLFEIIKLAGVQFEIFAEEGHLTSFLGLKRSSGTADLLHVDVNILGPVESSQQIGEKLSSVELYLQDPRSTGDSRRYLNPQVLALEVSESEVMLHELFLELAAKRNKAEQGNAWNTALDEMSQHALNADAVHVDTAIVTTPVLLHQREALDFMHQRELGGESLDSSMRFWAYDRTENGNAVYRHRITADERAQQQVEPQGGILADEMGLGKTLTAISLVVSSLERGKQLASQFSVQSASQLSDSRLHSRATLVAVPSTQLMDSWFEQLHQHTQSGKLKVARYHGHERVRLANDLVDNDIVITTYGTIAKEYSKPRRQVLYRICFFRIILDEAHIIRTRRTKLFTAIVELDAVHHWCLTGTPVSNKIDDLYALLHFCRVPLLGNDLIFRQHVTVPSRKSFHRGCSILREALRPICLRRNKGIVGLADPVTIEKEIQFSPLESKRYHRILETGTRAIDANVSGRVVTATRAITLKLLLELRIFCSQGTFRPDNFMDDQQKLDSDELFTLLEESEDVYCASCHMELTGIDQIDDEDSGVLGVCSHILCATCYNSQLPDGPPIECPSCKQAFRAQDMHLSSRPANTSSAVVRHSCKLDAVVHDLLFSQNAQTPEKSIVFSSWRKTIDLAKDLCSKSGIRALVLHGKTPQAERTKILDRFAEDPTISALLMTIGTGGLGLTINAASRVHLLEPQWNPFVEDQAIGRVVRLGQDKPITVIRYIIKDSVDRQIQGYQKRKKVLAASGFSHRSDNTSAEETVRLNAAYIA